MSVPRDFEKLLALLNSAKARYLLVGAYALAYHGVSRFTGDMDIFIDATAENADRVFHALQGFGFGNVGISVADLGMPDRIIQLGFPPLRIDLITGIDGVRFEKAWMNRQRKRFGRQQIWVIAKPDLIRNKRATGRKRDLLDIELLKEASKENRSSR